MALCYIHSFQADYALAFVEYQLNYSDDDKAILTSRRTIERQLRRLKKQDVSTGLSDQMRDFKYDLYFQHFAGQQLHSSLESVVK